MRQGKYLVKESSSKPQYVFIQHGSTLQLLTMGDFCEETGEIELRGNWSAHVVLSEWLSWVELKKIEKRLSI